MDYNNETEIMNSGGMGRVLAGHGGYGGAGIWDLLALGLIAGDGLFGNRRKDDCCYPQPATCESVNSVHRDVLETANKTQHEMCEATHSINSTITAGNNSLSDKITDGFYGLNDKLTTLAYAQQATAKDTQTLIVEKFAALEASQLQSQNCALEQEVNRYKTIEALSGHSYKGKC